MYIAFGNRVLDSKDIKNIIEENTEFKVIKDMSKGSKREDIVAFNLSVSIDILNEEIEESININELDEDSLDSLYKEYVASQSSINNDNIKEELLNSSIVTINDIPYFVTDVYSLSNDVTVYTRKYYTVVRGYIYTYAIQSKTDKVSDDMNNNLVSIINSAKYQKVKNSPLQNAVFTETLSNIITVGVPILILLVILLVITKVGPKGRAKRVNEEARLREEYKRTHNK